MSGKMLSSRDESRARTVPAFATVVYVLISSVAALATPVLGGRRVPIVLWGLATLGLIAILVRSARRKALSSDRPESIEGAVFAVLVGLVAAYVAFVVMVNIWERLGIPH
jgi:hypothetical protein